MFRNQLLDQQSTDFSLSAYGIHPQFSTITALRNAPSASHVDGNNAEAGMVTMTTCGNFTGGDFVFLEFGSHFQCRQDLRRIGTGTGILEMCAGFVTRYSGISARTTWQDGSRR